MKIPSTSRKHLAFSCHFHRSNTVSSQPKPECRAQATVLAPALSVPYPRMGCAGLRTNLILPHSTVPTNDHIMVPETLLKKRKSQEKARAERTSAIEKKKAVRIFTFSPFTNVALSVMHNYTFSTRHLSMLLIINLLSGLMIRLTSFFFFCQSQSQASYANSAFQ